MNSPTARGSVSINTRVATKFIPSQLEAIKDWHVIRHLGTGSTAHVWLLQHQSGDRYVACKTPKEEQAAFILSQEAELAASLSHENLITQLSNEVPQSDRSSVVSFWEYLPAGSLTNLIAATGKLTVAETVTVLFPMIQVADYLHTKQVVHGDISPDNILFDLTGRPVLIDLGASRATAHSYTSTGTPGFTAPEVPGLRREWDGLGAATDVYSLAAVGWFCLTGTVPGPPHSRVPLVELDDALGQEIIELLEASLSEQPDLRPSVDQLLKTVPYWAVPEPVDLYANVGEDYELLLPTRKPVGQEPRPRRSCRRRGQGRSAVSKTTSRGNAKLTASPRHIGLGVAGLLLILGSAGVVVYGDESTAQHAEQDMSPDTSAKPPDFQSVIDTVAKDRTAAWAASDASLVGDYAVSNSAIFDQDISVLESLSQVEHTLDGIRMRATVIAAEQTENGAEVSVQWHVDGYIQRDDSGEPVEEFEATTDELRLILDETADGWKIREAVKA